MTPGIDYIGITTPFYCNDGKGHFVMHKRSIHTRDEHGRWDFGGGQVEIEEPLEHAVLREVKEEYGVVGKIQEQIPAHSVFRMQNGQKTHWIAIPFFVKVNISKVQNKEPKKISEIRIVTLDKLPTPIHSGLEKALIHYKTYFDRYLFT